MSASSHLKAKSPVKYTKAEDHVGKLNALLNSMPEPVLSLIQERLPLIRKARKATLR